MHRKAHKISNDHAICSDTWRYLNGKKRNVPSGLDPYTTSKWSSSRSTNSRKGQARKRAGKAYYRGNFRTRPKGLPLTLCQRYRGWRRTLLFHPLINGLSSRHFDQKSAIFIWKWRIFLQQTDPEVILISTGHFMAEMSPYYYRLLDILTLQKYKTGKHRYNKISAHHSKAR